MTDQQLKKRRKKEKEEKIEFDLGESFDVEDAKDEDFDLDLDAAKFQGKKGQAGTRTKGQA